MILGINCSQSVPEDQSGIFFKGSAAEKNDRQRCSGRGEEKGDETRRAEDVRKAWMKRRSPRAYSLCTRDA